jgi:hypothetical protein
VEESIGVPWRQGRLLTVTGKESRRKRTGARECRTGIVHPPHTHVRTVPSPVCYHSLVRSGEPWCSDQSPPPSDFLLLSWSEKLLDKVSD